MLGCVRGVRYGLFLELKISCFNLFIASYDEVLVPIY